MTATEGMAIAKKYLEALFPELSGSDIQLEELEVPPFGSRWRYTFSGVAAPKSPNTLIQVMSQRRITKSVEIDPQSGDLIAMKNVAA